MTNAKLLLIAYRLSSVLYTALLGFGVYLARIKEPHWYIAYIAAYACGGVMFVCGVRRNVLIKRTQTVTNALDQAVK